MSVALLSEYEKPQETLAPKPKFVKDWKQERKLEWRREGGVQWSWLPESLPLGCPRL